MLDYDDMARACRYNDARLEETGDMDAYFAERGVDFGGLKMISEQRALRVLMMARGEDPNLTRPTPVRLDAMERSALITLQGVFVDGFAAMLAAKHEDHDPRGGG